MTTKQVKKELKQNGEVKIKNITLILQDNTCEITSNENYIFESSNWYEIEDYLIESGICENI